MNLHINVIRGSCMRGYFQQEGLRGCQACKVSLHVCKSGLLLCHLNVDLTEMNLFIRLTKCLRHVHELLLLLLTYKAHVYDVRFMGANWELL